MHYSLFLKKKKKRTFPDRDEHLASLARSLDSYLDTNIVDDSRVMKTESNGVFRYPERKKFPREDLFVLATWISFRTLSLSILPISQLSKHSIQTSKVSRKAVLFSSHRIVYLT